MSHDDFDFEPIPGLPAELPAGESLLWQGRPDWKSLAIQAYHVRKAAFYFAALIAWRIGMGVYHGDSGATIAISCAFLAVLGSVAIGVMTLLAYCSAKAAVYSITTRRVLIRHGIAVPLTLNIPFKAVQAAALRNRRNHCGDIAIAVQTDARIGYLITWPYVKPGSFSRPQPSLRALLAPEKVAAVLASALASDAGQSIPNVTTRLAPTGNELEPTPSRGTRGSQVAVA